MKVNLYYPEDRNKLACKAIQAFADAIPGARLFPNTARYQPADVIVIFGWVKKSYRPSWEKQRLMEEHDGPVIVIERGYVDRERYFSAGIGGINGRANFKNYDVKGDRWDDLGVDLRPWRTGGDYVLVVGQVPWDVTVQDSDHGEWCYQTVRSIKETERKVRFRPHPLATRKAPNFDYKVRCPISERSLEADLAGASHVVTWSSNVGVLALIEGIPTIAVDQSFTMTRGVSGRSLEDLYPPPTPDRTKWAHRLAYSQWTLDEFRKGLAWRHLMRDA